MECLGFIVTNKCPYDLLEIIRELDCKDSRCVIDFDKYSWLRTLLFPYVDTELLSPYVNSNLFNKCTSKIDEINCQKLYAYRDAYQLPSEVVTYIICEYF